MGSAQFLGIVGPEIGQRILQVEMRQNFSETLSEGLGIPDRGRPEVATFIRSSHRCIMHR